MSVLERIYRTLFIAADRNIATTLSADKKKKLSHLHVTSAS